MKDVGELTNLSATSWRDPWIRGLVAVVFFTSLLSAPAVRYDGDVIAWEMEAESLVHRGELAVRPSVAESLARNSHYFVFNPQTGNYYSKYGIGNTLIYALPLAFDRYVLGNRTLDPPGEIFGRTAGPYKVTRRLGVLNGFNLLLTVFLAVVLYRLARLFTSRGSSAALYVVACLYSTYLWNYTRAQSSQIYQVLLFSLAILFLLQFARTANGAEPDSARDKARNLLGCATSLAVLCAVKLVFIPLLGLFGVALVFSDWKSGSNPILHATRNLRQNFALYLRCGVLPLSILALLLLWANQLKFGSPVSTGYESESVLFSFELAKSIPAYLFGPRFSIFLHFPVLVLSLFGVRAFWREHRFAWLTSWACFALMFLIYASYNFWKGEASYGPRYLVFAMPVVSLPFVSAIDLARDLSAPWQRALVAAAGAVVLLVASFEQVSVNRLEFHAFFRLRNQFKLEDSRDAALWSYLEKTDTGTFNRDFIRYRDKGIEPLPMQRLEQLLSSERYAKLQPAVKAHLGSNHYFW